MKDKVVIITGCSSGIGKSLAYAFAEIGSKVVMASRNESKLKEIEKEITCLGQVAYALAIDVSKEDDCRRLIEFTVEKFGRIDILINNAGISMRATFKKLKLEVIHTMINTNFWGTVYCTKYALPYLLKSKGSVVGVSSIAGFQGIPCRTGYSASKYAMQGFLETLRIEHLHDGLHVMIACPGFTSTNIRKNALNEDGLIQSESPRNESKMMSSQKVAQLIIKGIKRRKRTLVITATGKMIIFLNKMFPCFVDKQIYRNMANEPNSPLK